MSKADPSSLQSYCLDVSRRAKEAARVLAHTLGAHKDAWLLASAKNLRQHAPRLIAANAQDLEAAPGYGLTAAQIDRLRLTDERLEAMAVGLEQIAALRDPVGELIDAYVRPNGLEIRKIRVPLGVVFFIYESRPNVTADAAAICVKSGNAVILRGGKEAIHSSQAIVDILTETAAQHQLPADAVQMVSTTDRQAVGHFLALNQYIDVAIPRGGESLIRRVTAEATMPVIKHFAGNCHVYIDRSADPQMAEQITVNSKCQRMGVCNAAESLLVHAQVAPQLLPPIAARLIEHGVQLRGDPVTRRLVPAAVQATEEDYATEYLGPVISVKVVESLEEAIAHINRFGSGHTDAIVTGDLAAARAFTDRVDSAAVMVNASTRFHDGGQFGLGAEIGISTDKFHARGPCGLQELTSYKYVVYGDGHLLR